MSDPPGMLAGMVTEHRVGLLEARDTLGTIVMAAASIVILSVPEVSCPFGMSAKRPPAVTPIGPVADNRVVPLKSPVVRMAMPVEPDACEPAPIVIEAASTLT